MEDEKIGKVLSGLRKLEIGMNGRDFLLTWERSRDEVEAIATVARLLQDLHASGRSIRAFDTGLALAIFRDRSTRTRYSFTAAARSLGLGVAELDEEKSQVAHGETVRETANMISFLTEVIGIRDDMYLGEGNRYMRQVGEALDEGHEEGVLPRRPTVLNLQCDVDHPTQTMADLMMLEETFGSLEALSGKRIAMTWAYSPSYGKPLSVPQGIIGLMTRFGMDVVLAHPEGYDLLPDVVELASGQAQESGGRFTVARSMEEAFRDADVVYPKSWAPYHVMERRTALLGRGDREGLEELERQCLESNAKHIDWECDERKMSLTRGGEPLYMHCLPADISGVSCERGEVTAGVFEKYRLRTYREASFKPFVIAAVILLSRFPDPVAAAEGLARRGKPLAGV